MSVMLTCPLCGKRSGYEFRYGGEDKGPPPDPCSATPDEWFAHHWNACLSGPQKEWWCHKQGCGVWFTTDRDTGINREIRNGSGARTENES